MKLKSKKIKRQTSCTHAVFINCFVFMQWLDESREDLVWPHLLPTRNLRPKATGIEHIFTIFIFFHIECVWFGAWGCLYPQMRAYIDLKNWWSKSCTVHNVFGQTTGKIWVWKSSHSCIATFCSFAELGFKTSTDSSKIQSNDAVFWVEHQKIRTDPKMPLQTGSRNTYFKTSKEN